MVNTAEDFPRTYEAALATQDWSEVEPLIHRDACVTFSNGSVHRGKDAVERAFTRNFSMIQSEQYAVSNIHWVLRTENAAAYLFDFAWTGSIHGERVSGNGRGTAVLVREDGWKLLIEHLGPGEADR